MVTARCVRFIGPGRVEVSTEELRALGEGEVLVRTMFSGVSAGSEMLAYRGQLDDDLALDETIGALGGTFCYPFRYGYSCVGTIETTTTCELAEGTSVFAFHPHQDRFVASAADVVPLGSADPRAATLFPLVETALQVTLDAGARFEEPVIVIGLGVVGMLTAAMLQRSGARVLAVEPLRWRRDIAVTLGIRAAEPGAAGDELSAMRAADGVPLIIEASGNPEALASALPLLAHEGTALVASWYGTKEVRLALGAEFHRRRLTIRSSQVSTIPARLSGRWTTDHRRRTACDLLGKLPLDELATHTFPFEQAAEAFAAVDEGREGLMHVALGYRS
ncbi:MAG: zinc-binding alcohol dehydrogenase [Acidimicrobiia bacterium]|jgi:2-desacetyl-2-hydroxyethyl bacteriochlorophyllide A dehydrogenase|nr:zinc-binding alcohol dehydrogenase [Acidimicrobiia bacterium]